MQTKVRIISLLFVLSLLWTSMSAAIAQTKAPHAPIRRYIGLASWYGANRQGRKMANGKKFNPTALTAACWYFPLGTVIQVVNLSNGNAVMVTVTDRGPSRRLHRVLDLSEAAAEQLDYIGPGLAHVFVLPTLVLSPEHAEFSARLLEPPSEQAFFASGADADSLN